MEHIDHVVRHSLLGYDHLLASVDDEVASLVIAAVLAVFDPLVLIQVLELTEVTSKHDRNLANVDSSVVLLKDHLLDAALALAESGADS